MIITDVPAALLGLLRYGATPAAVAALAGRRSSPAVIDDDGVLSGRQLRDAVIMTAAGWRRAGGDHERIGLLGSQDRTFLIGLLAASLLGWDAVGLSPRHDDHRLSTLVDRLRLTAVAGVDTDRITRITSSRPALPVIGRPSRRGVRQTSRPRRRGRVVLLTSGTTGLPSANVRRRYGPSLIRPVAGLWRILQPGGGPMMIMAPVWHGYGLGLALLALTGGVPLLLTRSRRSQDRARIAERHAARTIVLLPNQLDALITRWPTRPRSLHRVITGSAPLSPELCRRALETLGPILINLYGSTEAGWATWAGPHDLARLPGTIGRPAPGVRVMIVDGELHVDSPLGTDPRRPTPTGDLAHRGVDDLLILDGRIDDVAVVDGNNVSLAAVRAALADHRAISWSTVRSEPDPSTATG